MKNNLDPYIRFLKIFFFTETYTYIIIINIHNLASFFNVVSRTLFHGNEYTFNLS